MHKTLIILLACVLCAAGVAAADASPLPRPLVSPRVRPDPAAWDAADVSGSAWAAAAFVATGGVPASIRGKATFCSAASRAAAAPASVFELRDAYVLAHALECVTEPQKAAAKTLQAALRGADVALMGAAANAAALLPDAQAVGGKAAATAALATIDGEIAGACESDGESVSTERVHRGWGTSAPVEGRGRPSSRGRGARG